MENADLIKDTSVSVFTARTEFYKEFCRKSYILITIFDLNVPEDGPRFLKPVISNMGKHFFICHYIVI